MMSFKTLCRAAAILACLAAIQAHAAPITTLYNTGVDNAGNTRAHGTVGDLHYSLFGGPAGSNGQTRILTSAGGYPVPPYIGDNSLSTWIGPNGSDDLDGPIGVYIYRTTFNLNGFDLSSVLISGLWSTDNAGMDIFINGHSLGYTTSTTQYSAGFASFVINNYFVSGINTIDFWVRNDGGPTALRTELTGTGELPEPGSIALLGLGLSAVIFTRKRKQA